MMGSDDTDSAIAKAERSRDWVGEWMVGLS
jgi:hypothetical protein